MPSDDGADLGVSAEVGMRAALGGPQRAGGRKVGPDLYETVKEVTDGLGDITLRDLGLTGFQWGWAVNAAKYIVGAPPVPNPAILTVNM